VWKIWSRTGAEVSSGTRALTALVKAKGNLKVDFEAVTGNPVLPDVTIDRPSDADGTAWNVAAANGAVFTGTTATRTIASQSGNFRMKQITLSTEPGNPIQLAAQAETCSTFRICHDLKGCEIETLPQACRNPVVDPKPHDHGRPPRQ
jgi:hypothetical protein